MHRALTKCGPFRLRVMAGALLGAALGLSAPLLWALPDHMEGLPDVSKFVPAMLGFILGIPGWPVSAHGFVLTLVVIVLFWATIGAVVFGLSERRSTSEHRRKDANDAQR